MIKIYYFFYSEIGGLKNECERWDLLLKRWVKMEHVYLELLLIKFMVIKKCMV